MRLIPVFIIIVAIFLNISTAALNEKAQVKLPDVKGNVLGTHANTTTYSIVHLSDTQNLASFYPDTYDYTFSYLDSIKGRYNISAIIITGDLVNSWKKTREWKAYTHAISETSIPVYVIAGNHDTKSGANYTYYTAYTGNVKKSYVRTLDDFNLVGINYVSKSLSSDEFARIRQILTNSSRKFTIIATHYYMDPDGTLSRLGTDIDKQLIIDPTIVMTGHMFTSVIMEKNISEYPVIEDLTNYQNGATGAKSRDNYSAGTIYTVTATGGIVEKITARTLNIYPYQSFGIEKVLYNSTPRASYH